MAKIVLSTANIVTEVHTEDELMAIPFWRQGNLDAHTPDAISVCVNPLVTEALHELWCAALRGIQLPTSLLLRHSPGTYCNLLPPLPAPS